MIISGENIGSEIVVDGSAAIFLGGSLSEFRVEGAVVQQDLCFWHLEWDGLR